MEREKFITILKSLNGICEEVNKESENSKVVYEVLQFSDLARKWDSVYNITEFYNYNWLGNIDFMHIPDFNQTLKNCKNYPIIIAKEKGTDELLGISTIKYDENDENNIDPYFPEENAKYFSVTGILTKRNNPYRGIGKKIYEIALRGAHNYEKQYPGTKMMCVIDCRNKQSLRALASAVDNIRQNEYVGENKELPVHILGYYELRDKEENKILEAPTLVVEVDLKEKNIQEIDRNNILKYDNNGNSSEELFQNLIDKLKEQLGTYGINKPVIEEDTDCGIVYFYFLQEKEKCKIQSIQIEPNGTEKGNDRTIRDDKAMYEFIGPMPPISVDVER